MALVIGLYTMGHQQNDAVNLTVKNGFISAPVS